MYIITVVSTRHNDKTTTKAVDYLILMGIICQTIFYKQYCDIVYFVDLINVITL